jgi:hypothetical protein
MSCVVQGLDWSGLQSDRRIVTFKMCRILHQITLFFLFVAVSMLSWDSFTCSGRFFSTTTSARSLSPLLTVSTRNYKIIIKNVLQTTNQIKETNNLVGINFCRYNFRHFANFIGVHESLYPQNRIFSATRKSLYPQNCTLIRGHLQYIDLKNKNIVKICM